MISEAQIDACIAEMFRDMDFSLEPAGLYDPLRYMISIGGKRIRPRLPAVERRGDGEGPGGDGVV